MTQPTPLPPDCARSYRALRRIAAGGYGEVWEAEQLALGRRVAVKLLHSEMVKESAQARRFAEEARITASLAHPNIIQVLDHGNETGQPWIVYELVSGASLRDLSEDGGLALATALDALAQVADGLEAAHACGVLHRDIKPDNVLQAEDGRFKVADFGIAKWTRDGAVQTVSGVIMGTPAYVAPEMVAGQPASVASDVYALAVTAFELITGRLPFVHPALPDMLKAHLSEEPPRASDLRSGLPADVDRVFATALAKDPVRRFQSARDFSAALAHAALAVRPDEGARPPALRATAVSRALPRGASGTSIVSSATRAAAIPSAAPVSPALAPPSKLWLLVLAGFLASVAAILIGVAFVYLSGARHRAPPPPAQAFPAPIPESTPAVEVDHLADLRAELERFADASDISSPASSLTASPLKKWKQDLALVRALYQKAVAVPPVHEFDYLVFAAPLARMVLNVAGILGERYADRNHYADRLLGQWRKELHAVPSPTTPREIVETLVVTLIGEVLAHGRVSWADRCSILMKYATLVCERFAKRPAHPTEISAAIGLVHGVMMQVTDVLWPQLETGEVRDRYARDTQTLLTRVVVPALRALPPEQRTLVAGQDTLLKDLRQLSAQPGLTAEQRALAGHSARSIEDSMRAAPAQRQAQPDASQRAAPSGGPLTR